MTDRTKTRWIAPFLLIGQLLFVVPTPSYSAISGTKIHDVRMGIYPDYTRLVFDAEGDRPLHAPTVSDGGLTVEFTKLQTGAASERTYKHPSAAITGVKFREANGTLQIHVPFRSQGTTVKDYIIPANPNRPGHYRLILDFYPEPSSASQTDLTDSIAAEAAEKKDQKTASEPKENKSKKQTKQGGAEEKSPAKAANKSKEEPLQNSSQPSKSKHQADKANNGKDFPQLPKASPEPTVPDSEEVRALYEKADSYFLAHEQSIDQDAQQILDLYLKALKAAPKSSRAPLAFYRCGLASITLGNLKKAEKYFQQAIAFGPDNSLFSLCWLKLGDIYHQKRSYIEAVEAFRFALRYPLGQSEKTEAHYALGRELSLLGVHQEALDNLLQCLKEDPKFYLKKPDLLKFLGESYFTVQQFEAGRENLFRYLNLLQDSPDRDLVLAKIAEIFLHQGEQSFANKLYAFIETRYADSEGDIIGKIRNAEVLEKQGDGDKDVAYSLYQELSKKSLSPPLKRFVFYKLASWDWRHGNYSNAMNFIEEVLRPRSDTTAQDELLSLKEKVLADWTRKAWSEQDHFQVVQLHEKHGSLLRSRPSPDLDAMFADSYGKLGIYSNAVEIYERLLNTSKKKNEEWLVRVAFCSLYLGDLDKAGQFCRQIQSEPLEIKKTELQGRIACQQKKYADAVKHFGRLFNKEKDFPPVEFESVISYAESLMGLAKHDEVLVVLERAYERMREGDAEKKLRINLFMSRCYQELKQPEKAIEAMERALAVAASEDQKSQLSYEISRLYVALGKPEKASKKLSQILGTSQSFWKTAAQQQLDSIQMLPAR